MKAPNYGEQN